MSQSEQSAFQTQDHLQQLFNRSKPRSRFIAQSHVQDQTDSISKQIVNGDIDVRRKKSNLDLPHDKGGYQQFLRKRFVDQFSKQKEQLQHRLGYVQNSLVHLEKFQYLKRRNSAGKMSNHRRSQQWKKEHQEQMKRLQDKKKQQAQKSKEKHEETEQLKQKIREEEKERKKAELLDSIKKVKQRTQKRQQNVKEEKQKLKELLYRKELYQKLQEQYKEKEENMLQERKKKLAQVRQLKQPVNLSQILEHEQKVIDILKDKEMMRSRQIRMNSSRAKAYKPSYQSMFYKQIAKPQEDQPEENPKQKLEKMRQFSEEVKIKFAPDIDEKKRREVEDRLEWQAKSRIIRDQKQRQLLQKPKLKGLEYLQLVKKMPKKKQDSRYNGPQTDRIAYKNYLGSISVDMGKPQSWGNILSKGDNKVQTAQMLKYESQRIEQRLKWKQVKSRANKIKDHGDIDQQYYEMVKAKLSLLSKE